MAEAGTDAEADTDTARGDPRGARSASPPDDRSPSSRRKPEIRKLKNEMDENGVRHHDISTGECCLATVVKVICEKKKPQTFSRLI